MNDEEKLSKWIKENSSAGYCRCCIYESGCPQGMVCYGGEPVEPPCVSLTPEEFLDMDAVLQDLEEEEREAV